MLINLVIVLPFFGYLLRYESPAHCIWHLVLIAAIVDFISTLNLILFCCYSFYTRIKRCPTNVCDIVVLGAAINHGQVSPVLASRLNHAIKCWQQHQSARIIVSGGQSQNEHLSEAAAMARYLVMRGIPAQLILRENHARNTRQNLLFTKRLITAVDRSVVVITSDFHVLRARLDARKIGLSWCFLGTKTPWQFRTLTFIRDYLGVIRDHYCLAGCVWFVGIVIAELLLT